jgi:hypothetical protein
VAESVPVRYQLRVKQRTKVVEFATQHDIKPASRYFGLDPDPGAAILPRRPRKPNSPDRASDAVTCRSGAWILILRPD